MTKTVDLVDVDKPAGFVTMPNPENPFEKGRTVPVRKISVGAHALAQKLARGEGTDDDTVAILRSLLPTATPEEMALLTEPQIERVRDIATQGVDAVLEEMKRGNPAAPEPTAPSSKPETGSATS